MKDTVYKYIYKKKKKKSWGRFFNCPLRYVHPLLLAAWAFSLFGLWQNTLVAFIISTCCVSPTNKSLRAQSLLSDVRMRVKFAANWIILWKTHLSKSRLAAESCVDSLQLLWHSYSYLKRGKKKSNLQLVNLAILYAGVCLSNLINFHT